MKKHYATLVLALSAATAQAQVIYQTSFVNSGQLTDAGKGVHNKANYQAKGGSYQHIGQFVNFQSWDARSGTDYFGSMQTGTPGYQGKGIQGNGVPYFGSLHLLNTGAFPLSNRPGGIKIAKELVFAESGSGTILLPNGETFRGANAVFLDPGVAVLHAGDRNHVKGFVHARTDQSPVLLPLGDGQRYFPLTLQSPSSSLLARYQATSPLKLDGTLESGISGFVSEGYWVVSPGQERTVVSIPIPENNHASVFVVGYDKTKRLWTRLGGTEGHGIVNTTDITALALAYGGDAPASATFTIWPNPAADEIFLKLPDGKKLAGVTILDPQARSVKTSGAQARIPVSDLPAGTYLLEISLTDGGKQQGRFIKK